MKNLEIYIHIPFCVKKCAYCDFLSAPASTEAQRQYLLALLREIRSFPRKEEYEVVSVFFGVVPRRSGRLTGSKWCLWRCMIRFPL